MGAVGVATDGLGLVEFEERVDADETAGGGVVVTGAGRVLRRLVARVVAEMESMLVPWGSATRMRTLPSLLVRTAEPHHPSQTEARGNQ
ncbi:hypothetical protein CF54_23185 [Streptomyces sp. Tu 6176]|nr:hypothetical protein CF54_23185 [Streptomyces sp. Tu 6176]